MFRDCELPDYILESSWEVCNKVGGIYTVLSTRANTLQQVWKDKLIFIGPDCWKSEACPYFAEDKDLYPDWQKKATSEGLPVRVGRWKIPGSPVAILVDPAPFYHDRDSIYGKLWEHYQVDSLHGYGDYDEASMFSYAAARVVESFYHANIAPGSKVIYQGNEWMTGLGLLYINFKLPQIATVFTTHATSIGRSIAGNNKPLYDYLWAYNGDQMAWELNMQSKHSIEKQTAHHVDCFTTVSDITAKECTELLDKSVDIVLPNGFDNRFVPSGNVFLNKRKRARRRLLDIANALTGSKFDDDTLIVSTSGRYEFRNKGIDVFIEAMNRLSQEPHLQRNVVAFIEVPGWVNAPRKDLQERMQSGKQFDTPLENPEITHWLNNMDQDHVLGMMKSLGMGNGRDRKVNLIFMPCYLTGDDGIADLSYYDVILGNDLCVYPSYYEPWGYTPLESIAFKVPCITTDLAGFGLWVNKELGKNAEIEDGVKVIHRTDYNYNDVAETVKDTVVKYAAFSQQERTAAREHAAALSKHALWKHFISYYYEAYGIALKHARERINK